jgi:hypothetical protein
MGGMVEDMQPHGASEKLPHRDNVLNIELRYLNS